jgi:general secretion pathway protein F
MSRQPNAPLPYRVRAELFHSLAAMERAGLAPDNAFILIEHPRIGKERLRTFRRLLSRRIDPATCGMKSGLFTLFESELVRAALEAGSPQATYARLAGAYAVKASRLARMRARLLLPGAVLALALFVQPLPLLASGAIDGGAYLWKAIGPLFALALLAWLALRAPLWFLSGAPAPQRRLAERLLLRLPVFGRMHARRNARDFYENLALLLQAGLPMFEALPVAAATVANRLLRAEFAAILPAMRKGATLAQASAGLTLIDTGTLCGLVHAGEQSGTLPELLLRHAGAESAALDGFQQQIADWGPRLFYALVCGWMGSQLLSSPVLRPALP